MYVRGRHGGRLEQKQRRKESEFVGEVSDSHLKEKSYGRDELENGVP